MIFERRIINMLKLHIYYDEYPLKLYMQALESYNSCNERSNKNSKKPRTEIDCCIKKILNFLLFLPNQMSSSFLLSQINLCKPFSRIET
jgi:hypothetical protein